MWWTNFCDYDKKIMDFQYNTRRYFVSNLADEMRKRTEKGKERNKKLKEDFEKNKRERTALLKDIAVKEAKELFSKAISEIEQSANEGKNNIEFLVGSCDSPSKETEEKLSLVAQHLAQLLAEENNNFDTNPICNISEEYVDSPRRIYVAVKIRW